MTDLEDRVRDALLARAGEFTTSPDAWERTTARAGRRAVRWQSRRPRRQRWMTRFTPLAAAAAVLVIAAGTAILAGTGGSQAPRVAPTSGAPGGFGNGSPCAFPGQSPKIPVTGVTISAKVTVDGVTTWWTRVPDSSFGVENSQGKVQTRTTNLALCQVHGQGGTGTPVWPLGQGQLVQAGSPATFLADSTSVSGLAVGSITSVTADLANGHVIQGSVAYGKGFPYAAWWVEYLQGISATLVFRDAAGHVVKELAEPYPPASSPRQPKARQLTTWDPTRACQQDRVQQRVADGTKVWTYIGFTVPKAVQPNHAPPTLCETTGTAGAPASFIGTYALPAGQNVKRIFALYPTSSVSGIVVPSATSVTAVLADGEKYTGTIVTNKLFTDPVWIVSYPLKERATLVFRNAAGAVVVTLTVPANP